MIINYKFSIKLVLLINSLEIKLCIKFWLISKNGCWLLSRLARQCNVKDFGFGLLQNTGCSACENKNISQFYTLPSPTREHICYGLTRIGEENTHLNSRKKHRKIVCVSTATTGEKFNNISAEIVSCICKIILFNPWFLYPISGFIRLPCLLFNP